ncbi:hypothetical protein EV182_003287 [Spiromyces aspiralis]|uniref:Uncharacterized protein n=1 Tax=Spiromyces aspiralis TaxID=68401 RepID=A0ACC1HE20_9FUNG|nr:hypothetical protein EV182_003287 [Spiromyces aspiralis]
MELLQTTAPRSMLYRTSAGFTTNIDCRQGMDAASTCINSLQLTERSSHDTVDSTEISSNQKEQGNDRRQDTPAAKQQACAQNSAPAANWLGLLYIRNYLSQFVWATQIVSHRAPPSIKWDQALSDVLCLDQTCSLEKATDHLISIYYESTYDIICFKLSCDDQDPESHRKYLQMVTYYSSNSKIGVHIPSPNNPYHMRHLYVFAQAPNQPWLEIFDIIEPQNFERKGETADRAWLFMFVTFKTRKSHRHPRKRGSLAPSPPHSPPPKSVESGSEDGDSGDEDSKNPTINASDPAADHRHTTSSLSSEKGSGSRRVHWKKDLVGMADPPQWNTSTKRLHWQTSPIMNPLGAQTTQIIHTIRLNGKWKL